VEVTFSGAVTDTDFGSSDFESTPSGRQADGGITNASANVLELDLDGSVVGDTSITYQGTVVNITTPQTVPYT
jgi:hypothetical protein